MFLVGWSRVPQAPGMTVRAKIETIADIAEEYAHAHASNAVERRACFLNRLDTGLSDIPSPSQESETIADIAGEYAPLFSRMSGFGGCAVMP